MAHELQFLSETTGSNLYQAFVEAFSDYALDMSYMNEERFLNRSLKNGVDYDCSVGAFVDGKMIGYTLVGVDAWNGVSSAYDIGTGIVKAYRGKGIAREMFRFAVPKLRKGGVKRFLLEVLQENEAAVKAYEKTGFKTVREFDCFQMELAAGTFDKVADEKVKILPAEKDQLDRAESFLDWPPSWENSFASIRRIPDEVMLLGAYVEESMAGLLVYYSALNWIMTVAVENAHRRKGIATGLMRKCLDRLRGEQEAVKIVNIEVTDEGMIEFLKKLGFQSFAKQYEMELVL